MAFDWKTLEFDKIVHRMKDHAQTKAGKERIRSLKPLNEETKIIQNLNETEEALWFIQDTIEPSFGGIYDLSEALKRARIGGTLSIGDFLDIKSHIDGTKRLKREMTRLRERLDKPIDLEQYSEELIVCVDLRKAIDQIIDETGEIRSSASTELSHIRRSLDTTEKQIKTALDSVLKKEAKKLTEQLITIRYNRYVVPVKLSEKNNMKGAILDYSSSGETAYIEPESVRDLSAKKERFESEEKREIEKLLSALTYQVKDYLDVLNRNVELITHLDSVFARAMYGHINESVKVTIGDRIQLIKARHPLIEEHEVVANTITFDEGVKTMVITGSNTGGKTVTLKTVGLLAMMAQSGCLIPASPGSKLPIFTQIRADIGDEQSIEQSLSTFSSHMKNIVNILDTVDDNSLILLDELGSGTDPNEGASLGMSILEYLSQKNVTVMATTHYPELKAYAYTRDSIVNASVEFDEKTLKPTYRLLLRTPGESHALLIGERLGLNKSIIEEAKKRVLTSETEVSELIDNLKNESKRFDQLVNEYEQLLKKTEQERHDVLTLKKSLQKEKETLKDRLALENRQLIESLRKEAESLIQDLEAMKEKSYKEHELATIKYKTKEMGLTSEESSQTKDHTYSVGDSVYILKYNRYGELVEQQKNKQWLVQMGRLSSVFKEKEFELAEDKPKAALRKPQSSSTAPKKTVSSELDLRGMRVHEAEEALHKYLDDCMVANMPFASIIHGFGTLALRKMVKELVSQNPMIDSVRDGKGNEGGQGVTIIYFK